MHLSFTMLFTPAMLILLLLSIALLLQSIRRKSAGRFCAAMGFFILMGACTGLLMEFITRM